MGTRSAVAAREDCTVETTDGVAGNVAGTGVTIGDVDDPARCVIATFSSLSFLEISVSPTRLNDGEDLFAG